MHWVRTTLQYIFIAAVIGALWMILTAQALGRRLGRGRGVGLRDADRRAR